jgi:hypothetical protein
VPVEPEVPVVELVADPVVPVDDVDVLDFPDDIVAFARMNSPDEELVPVVVVALLEEPVACCRQPVTVTLSLSDRSVALLLVVGCWATSVAQATTLIATRVLDHTFLLIDASRAPTRASDVPRCGYFFRFFRGN